MSFLNITPNVTHFAGTSAGTGGNTAPSTPVNNRASNPTGAASNPSFVLTFDENPLAEFVELPEEALEGGLWYSNVLCGVLRGALEMVRVLYLMIFTWIGKLRERCRFRYALRPSL